MGNYGRRMEDVLASCDFVIQGVFFDLDGTLYDRDAAIVKTAEHQFEAFQKNLKGVSREAFIAHLVALDRHGHPRIPQLYDVLAKKLGLSTAVGERLEEYFHLHYWEFCLVPEDTLHTLERLRDRGKRLGIITNGPAVWQSRKIEAMKIGPLFDVIVISGNEGVEKPDARIFARAMERCGVSAEESMFVGDHPQADVEGAKKAGMFAVWKRKEYWTVPDDVPGIDRISEILHWID